ncbi:hypothetical protein [Pseudonocardia acaciae]|uniref:hypothetical protein n=1 Tax=Pseudonocardia acaciae TaxID=551276 RepID=UPI0012EDF923|nr:hypothetical protein [Pseudonocardia acaciae]
MLAYAIQAAGRINRREPPTSPSSRDYERVRLVLLRALLTPDTLHAVILHHDTTLGPIGDQPGHDFLGPVLRISEQPERWRELADRAAGVIVDHHRDSATGDLFDPMLEIGDRHIPMIELYKARVVGSSSNERGDAR